MKKILVLGSTGSIGTQTLDIVQQHPDTLSVVGLSGGRNIDTLVRQVETYKPKVVCVQNDTDREDLSKRYPDIHWVAGETGLIDMLDYDADMIVIAIAGTAALPVTHAAIQKGMPIALASKEVLVSAGELIMRFAKEKKVPMIPIDSEHAALYQCLCAVDHNPSQIKSVTLTASGGPFWNRPIDQMDSITVEDALKHPNWDMGNKITIDSATLMNKGLEIIEAHYLFDIPYEKLSAVIHPNSIVHAMLETIDHQWIAQMAIPDMRIPIQYALSHPDRWDIHVPSLSLTESKDLAFHPVNTDRFPLFKLALDVGKEAGPYPAILNAANEKAVNLFLQRKLSFAQMIRLIRRSVEEFPTPAHQSLEDIIQIHHDVANWVCAESAHPA